MIKSVLSFMKKIPASEQYSSQSFHLSMEAELPDNLREEELEAELTRRFDVIKGIVDAQLATGDGAKQSDSATSSTKQLPGKGVESASNAQLKFLSDISRQADVSLEKLTEKVRDLYQVDSIYALTKKDCSSLITEFKRLSKKAA